MKQVFLNFIKNKFLKFKQNKERKRRIAIIKKGVPYSSFGDAAEYQREIRKDRKLPFRD